jgi:hypothetical protein
MTIFLTTKVPTKTKASRKITSISKRLSKDARKRMKSGECVTVYSMTK